MNGWKQRLLTLVKIRIMKKIIIFLFCFTIANAKATVWTVTTSNFQFSPSTLNVVVGDVIHWEWAAGNHTTTSISIPASAAPWDAILNSGNISFDYTVTQAGTYNYNCTPHAPGMAGSFTASSVLPITLSSFNISSINGNPVLKWTTASESNADYFSVKKSSNGTDFKELAKVQATGNTTIEKNYSYTDIKADGARFIYYYLAMVDKNGKTQLSPIKIYRNNIAEKKLIILLSPNPVSSKGHLMLHFNAEEKSTMIAKIYDQQGRLVLTSRLSAEKGLNNGHIHLGSISAGQYTIRFSLKEINETYKITKE